MNEAQTRFNKIDPKLWLGLGLRLIEKSARKKLCEK